MAGHFLIFMFMNVFLEAKGQEPKPVISLQLDNDFIDISCSLPDSVKDGSKCNLYFGEASEPYQTSPILKTTRNKGRTVCLFNVSAKHFLTNLNTVQTKDVSCDYTSESGHGALSPRSDGYNLKNLMNTLETNQPHVTTASLDSVMTTNTETRRTTGSETEATTSDLDFNPRPVTSSTGANKTHLTPIPPRHKTTLKDSVVKKTSLQPESGDSSSTNKPSTSSSLNSHKTLLLVILVSVCGVTLISVMLVIAFFWRKQTKRKGFVKRSQGSKPDDMDTQGPHSTGMPLAGEVYSLITSVPTAAGCSTGSVTVNRKELQNEDVNESNPYHLYATISDEPTSITMKNMVYSTLQMTDN